MKDNIEGKKKIRPQNTASTANSPKEAAGTRWKTLISGLANIA